MLRLTKHDESKLRCPAENSVIKFHFVTGGKKKRGLHAQKFKVHSVLATGLKSAQNLYSGEGKRLHTEF